MSPNVEKQVRATLEDLVENYKSSEDLDAAAKIILGLLQPVRHQSKPTIINPEQYAEELHNEAQTPKDEEQPYE